MERTRKSIRSTLAVFLLMVMCSLALAVPASAATTTYEYKSVKVKNLSKELSNTPFATVQGQPGVTLSITATKSFSRSFSYTVNGKISIKDLNASVGWSNSKSDTVSISKGGSWKVPQKANNKNVKYGTLKGYVYYDRVQYNVLRRTKTVPAAGSRGAKVRYGNWETYKTGCIAKKASNNSVAYRTYYTYK